MPKENPSTKPAGAAPKRVNLEELAKQMLENLNDPEARKAVEAREEELGDEMQKAASRAYQARVDGKKPAGAAPKAVNLEELAKEMLENLNDPEVSKAVDAAEEELADEMRKATLRAFQAKVDARKPR